MMLPLHPKWRFALTGAVASLPVTALLRWLPNSGADVGGGVMVVGAFIAGALATINSANPNDAGLRAGFFGGVLSLLIFVVTAGTMVEWSLLSVVFWAVAGGVFVCFASLFGLVFGHLGGWVTNTFGSRWMASSEPS